jgi:hypothetical protein
MERYQRIEKKENTLGAGTYGVVYKAKDKVTDMFVAMKVNLFFILILIIVHRSLTTLFLYRSASVWRLKTMASQAQLFVKSPCCASFTIPTLLSEFLVIFFWHVHSLSSFIL